MLTSEDADRHLAKFRLLDTLSPMLWPEALKHWLLKRGLWHMGGPHSTAKPVVFGRDLKAGAAEWVAANSPSTAQQLNNEARGECADAWSRKIIRLAHGDEECHVLVADLLREYGKRAAEKERARVEALCALREQDTRETVGTAAGLLHTTPELSDTLMMARDALDAAMLRMGKQEV